MPSSVETPPHEQSPVSFTPEEYVQLRDALHHAMSALHYANKDPITSLPRYDKNIMHAIGVVGPAYRMLKAKESK